ncbi:MAG: hypothetical protein GEU99_25000 [Luteitalea sp.]|nr:hypothetical protein [Luteitalea sp.]
MAFLRTSRALGLAVALTATLGPLSSRTFAQALYGSVTGTVADDSDAGVPGVTIILANDGTGLQVETVTDAQGSYTVRNVPPGAYTLTATLEGFKTFVQTGIPVTAGSIIRINGRLEIGELSESVTVTTEEAPLQTDKADVSVELKAEQIINLPLNQFRNYQSLVNLVPGATPATFQNSRGATPARSLRTFVNGTNPNNNLTRIDGAASINLWLPHHAGYVAPAETIDTVSIVTNNFEADTGMAGGAAISVVTKSGTNELRGSGFFFRSQDELNASTFFDNANDLDKPEMRNSIYGGTLGGPIKRNRLFYFGAWERFDESSGDQQTFTVPTDAMRVGDFREVRAVFPEFRLFDPLTGNPDGTGRAEFADVRIPTDRLHEVSQRVLEWSPLPNAAADPNRNGLADDYAIARQPTFERDNFDAKITFSRTAAHQIWGKISYLHADVADVFLLGFDEPAVETTKVTSPVVGHTWTLSPTVVLDGSFGVSYSDQEGTTPDFGQNYGLDLFGIPGTNGPDPRQSGLPFFANGLSGIGNSMNTRPYFWTTRVYSFSQALTKVAGRHELRAGYDMHYMTLDHWQPEVGAGPRGRFDFSGNVTGALGYQPVGGWNAFAGFLLGLPSEYGKSVQAEEMTAREWQHAFYVRDRWQVSDKLTLNGGVRFEIYPLMTRADRGIERLDFETFDVLLGGRGDVPEDVGIDAKTLYIAPRIGAAYRLDEHTVFRAGYGVTYNPLPWSRPLRGFYPLTVGFGDAAVGFDYLSTLQAGIPDVPVPDLSTGRVPLPSGVQMRTPNPNDVDRATLRQWNITLERRLPLDLIATVAYVGTRTDGGYADVDLNWAAPGTGNEGRQFFAEAGNTAILDWAARTRSRYHSLQATLNRQFKNGLLLKGAYTWGKAMNEADEDGWTGLTWDIPDQQHRNYAKAGYDRTHIFQMGFVYELPFLRASASPVAHILKNWQVNGTFSAFSGTPFSISANNPELLAPGAGLISADQIGELRRVGSPGPDEPFYDPSAFANPSGLEWGNTGRNAFRGPAVWNLDLSVFRIIPIGRLRGEIRAQASNVFNHTRWLGPTDDLNNTNFMRHVAANSVDAPRAIQLGLRIQF